MSLQQWQREFESWLSDHHREQDAAHDIFHFRRVWATAQKLSAHETVDGLVVLAACYFHDIISLPKNHPERHRSSVLAAKEASRILMNDFPSFPQTRIPAVVHAIEAHSFSAKITPATLEAKIVQDADRLEALGAIGLARVFAVSGALGVVLFDEEDPFAQNRSLNDKQFALDHFQSKLLMLPKTMQTAKGKALAEHNADFLVAYMAKLSAELNGEYESLDHTVIQSFSADR